MVYTLVVPHNVFGTLVVGMLVEPCFGYILNFDHGMMEHDGISFEDPLDRSCFAFGFVGLVDRKHYLDQHKQLDMIEFNLASSKA